MQLKYGKKGDIHMGAIIGQKEYNKFKEGKSLTVRQAVLSQCYVCNGQKDSRVDCKGYSCTLYPFSPYGEESRYPYTPKKPKGRVGGNPNILRDVKGNRI